MQLMAGWRTYRKSPKAQRSPSQSTPRKPSKPRYVWRDLSSTCDGTRGEVKTIKKQRLELIEEFDNARRAGVGAYSCQPKVPSTYIDHKTIRIFSWRPSETTKIHRPRLTLCPTFLFGHLEATIFPTALARMTAPSLTGGR